MIVIKFSDFLKENIQNKEGDKYERAISLFKKSSSFAIGKFKKGLYWEKKRKK